MKQGVSVTNISIHAPTRGATQWMGAWDKCLEFQSTLLQEERHERGNYRMEILDISIHAPTRGATRSAIWSRTDSSDFNPRSYKRSDFCIKIIIHINNWFQSTLLQEERLSSLMEVIEIRQFQSTLLQEERLYLFCTCSKRLLFQSTLLQEERQFRCNSLASVLNFNPRSYKRSDNQLSLLISIYIIFQSTLLQEERRLS